MLSVRHSERWSLKHHDDSYWGGFHRGFAGLWKRGLPTIGLSLGSRGRLEHHGQHTRSPAADALDFSPKPSQTLPNLSYRFQQKRCTWKAQKRPKSSLGPQTLQSRLGPQTLQSRSGPSRLPGFFELLKLRRCSSVEAAGADTKWLKETIRRCPLAPYKPVCSTANLQKCGEQTEEIIGGCSARPLGTFSVR